MDLKKVGGVLAMVLILLWVVGRFVSSPSHTSNAASEPDQPTPQDKWQVKEDRSPMDDSKVVVLTLDSDDMVRGPIESKKPSLIIRCKEKKSDLYIVTGMAASIEEDIDGGPSGFHKIRVRLDDSAAKSESWGESTDHTALFVSDHLYDQSGHTTAFSGGVANYAKRLATARILTFEFTPFDGSPQVARFDLRGLDTHLNKVAEVCGWHVD